MREHDLSGIMTGGEINLGDLCDTIINYVPTLIISSLGEWLVVLPTSLFYGPEINPPTPSPHIAHNIILY